MPRPHARTATAIAIAVTLLVSGCKKKDEGPRPTASAPVARVETRLQVTTVSPDRIQARSNAELKVYGAAFEAGATVTLGGERVADVAFVDPNTLSLTAPTLPAGSHDVTVRNPDGTSATLRSVLTVERPVLDDVDCRFVRILFGFDSAGLDTTGRDLLDARMACYQKSTGSLQVAGHADERGTTDYNLDLGQRRAETVRDHLVRQGVSTSRVKAVSFGEERPADSRSSEAAWAANRRAEVSAE